MNKIILIILSAITFISCKENIKQGTLSVDMKYFDKKQEITVGFEGTMGDFFFSKSSLPVEFIVDKVYEENGGSVAELNEMLEVEEYKTAVSTNDSDEARNAKKVKVKRPALELEKYTGKLIVRKGNNILPGTYHFDVRLKNVSGEKLIKDALILKVNAFELTDLSSALGGKPEITYLGDSPEQVVFKVYKYNSESKKFEQISTKEHLYISKDAFEYTDEAYLLSDSDVDGEKWKVKFPAIFYANFKDIDGENFTNYGWAKIYFGRKGSYEVKVFVK